MQSQSSYVTMHRWQPHPSEVKHFVKIWNYPAIDLFTYENPQCNCQGYVLVNQSDTLPKLIVMYPPNPFCPDLNLVL